jgi:Protein of unknown function (DUF1360)
MTQTLDSAPPFADYADTEQPFGSYALLTAAFNVGLAGALISAHRRGRLPEQIATKDIIVLGIATHKISRLLTKDAATSFMRAPFVRLHEKSGNNSLDEEPRGSGLQRSIGELLSCPECTGNWVASGLAIGLIHTPRVTRVIGAMYASLAIGDMLQYAYVGLKSRA